MKNPFNKNVTAIDKTFIILDLIVLVLATIPPIFKLTNVIEPWAFGLPFSYVYQLVLAYVWVILIVIQVFMETARGDEDPEVIPDHDYLNDAAVLDEDV